jgi:GNAT superfamily N-acetyltransferase
MDDGLTIRLGQPADAAVVVALFDEAVAWMVARDQTEQWGTEPFSASPRKVKFAKMLAGGGGLRIAELRGVPVGVLAVGDRPDHVSPATGPELYINLLLSSRRYAGRDIGGALVRRAVAEAREAGLPRVRVDCWAGAPTLVAWYERQGFTRTDRFNVNDGWIGQVLAIELTPEAQPPPG